MSIFRAFNIRDERKYWTRVFVISIKFIPFSRFITCRSPLAVKLWKLCMQLAVYYSSRHLAPLDIFPNGRFRIVTPPTVDDPVLVSGDDCFTRNRKIWGIKQSLCPVSSPWLRPWLSFSGGPSNLRRNTVPRPSPSSPSRSPILTPTHSRRRRFTGVTPPITPYSTSLSFTSSPSSGHRISLNPRLDTSFLKFQRRLERACRSLCTQFAEMSFLPSLIVSAL